MARHIALNANMECHFCVAPTSDGSMAMVGVEKLHPPSFRIPIHNGSDARDFISFLAHSQRRGVNSKGKHFWVSGQIARWRRDYAFVRALKIDIIHFENRSSGPPYVRLKSIADFL